MTQDNKPQPRPFRIGEKVLIAGPEPRRAGRVTHIDAATGDIHVQVDTEFVRVSPQDLEPDRRPRPRRKKFEVGEIVRIIGGPFVDFSGVVEAVFPEQERLRVAAMVFGRSTPTELSFSEVEKS